MFRRVRSNLPTMILIVTSILSVVAAAAGLTVRIAVADESQLLLTGPVPLRVSAERRRSTAEPVGSSV
jgi:hypothetical protein